MTDKSRNEHTPFVSHQEAGPSKEFWAAPSISTILAEGLIAVRRTNRQPRFRLPWSGSYGDPTWRGMSGRVKSNAIAAQLDAPSEAN
jgi:hypothetical protein